MAKLHPHQITFTSLLADKDLELLALPSGIPVEKLQAIADGARPSDEDIAGLTCALGVDSDKLIKIRKELFGNGQKSEVKVRGR